MNTNTEASEFSGGPAAWFWKFVAVISVVGLVYKLWRWEQFDISHLTGFALPISLLVLSASNIFVPNQGRLYQAGQIIASVFFAAFIILAIIEMIQ